VTINMFAKPEEYPVDPARFRFSGNKERPDYYITPTRDFTQYTRDYEEKYWSKDSAFAWQQNVPANLKAHLESVPSAELLRVAMLALPMVDMDLGIHIEQVRDAGLPHDDDALVGMGESLPDDGEAISKAMSLRQPLTQLGLPGALLNDRLAILNQQLSQLREDKRIGLFWSDAGLKRLETESERQRQNAALVALTDETQRTAQELQTCTARTSLERSRLNAEVTARMRELEPLLLSELTETCELVRRTLRARVLPADQVDQRRVLDLILKRQMRGLKDIANHALVVEQSAIAPLTMGVIHYKRRREIQEAMTTFVSDEAKHSAVFRRFMAEKLGARERIPEAILSGSDRHFSVARFMPGAAMFLAVVVEAIGGAFLEFFGNERHMPEPLFRSICKTIAERDEKRHVELCAATYNELYRKGGHWEQFRNNFFLKAVMQAAYGNKTEDHYLLRACRSFGVEPNLPYHFIASRLSQQLTQIGMYVPVEEFLGLMRRSSSNSSA
jgi:hypothetical protein